MDTQLSAHAGLRDVLLGLACDRLGDLVLVATVTEDGGVVCLAANRRFTERFTGGEDVAERAPADVLPGPTAAALTAAARAVRNGGESVGYDESIPDTAKGPTDVAVRVSPLGDADEQGPIVVSWTATERTALFGGGGGDGRLAEANRHLRAENRELSRSNLDLNQFAYVASHDLVEPLRMVTSYLDLLSDRYGAELDEQARRYIEFAVDGATRMRALIDDLLVLAKVSSSDDRIDRVDLTALAEQVVADLGMRIEETGAAVRIEPLPVVRGAAGRLHHALGNLVANALKFRRPDVAPVVTVSASRTDAGWRVTVLDNGIGVKPEFRSQVFDMFRRLHPRTAYPGTGMGLAIVKSIVERHGGEVGVDAAPGGGCAFWFTLPDTVPTHHDNPERGDRAS